MCTAQSKGIVNAVWITHSSIIMVTTVRLIKLTLTGSPPAIRCKFARTGSCWGWLINRSKAQGESFWGKQMVWVIIAHKTFHYETLLAMKWHDISWQTVILQSFWCQRQWGHRWQSVRMTNWWSWTITSMREQPYHTPEKSGIILPSIKLDQNEQRRQISDLF